MDVTDRIKAALALMSPGPWEADVDDPETDPQWTGKFYTGDRGARGTSWCTYDDSDPDTLPNVRGIAVLVTEVPALLAEVEDLRRGAHDAAVALVERDRDLEQIRELEVEVASLRRAVALQAEAIQQRREMMEERGRAIVALDRERALWRALAHAWRDSLQAEGGAEYEEADAARVKAERGLRALGVDPDAG